MIVVSLPLTDYSSALDLQVRVHSLRKEQAIEDCLLLLEHPPTITIGKHGNQKNVLISKDWLEQNGVRVYKIGRGGDVTYHGPGQLVGYLIFHLSVTRGSIKRFVYLLEESIIRTLREFGIEADRNPLHRGVWIGQEKIAALGLSVSRQVTMHGFALNVRPDLSHFRWIIPCGIRDAGVTSMERILKRPITIEEVKPVALHAIADTFGFSSIQERPAPVIQPSTQEEVHR